MDQVHYCAQNHPGTVLVDSQHGAGTRCLGPEEPAAPTPLALSLSSVNSILEGGERDTIADFQVPSP